MSVSSDQQQALELSDSYTDRDKSQLTAQPFSCHLQTSQVGAPFCLHQHLQIRRLFLERQTLQRRAVVQVTACGGLDFLLLLQNSST